MSKIWEVNFTNFSGVSDVAYDEIGSQHLTTSTGIVKLTTISGFTYRPGVAFTKNDVLQVYGLRSSGATNACFNVNFSQRSFVMWLYLPSYLTDGAYFEGTGDSLFWGEWNTSAAPQAGMGRSSTGNLTARVGSTVLNLSPAGSPGPGWHLLILTIDKVSPQTNFYCNNVLVGTTSSVSSNTPGTFNCIIGDVDITRESTFQVGLCTTYDHILTSGERQALYDTFLKDILLASQAYQSFSGTLYSTSGTPEPNATIYSIYLPISHIVSSGQTTSSGTYIVDLPYSGAYSTVFTSSPTGPSRSVSVVATSGGVYFP